jgi:hypothetical protein
MTLSVPSFTHIDMSSINTEAVISQTTAISSLKESTSHTIQELTTQLLACYLQIRIRFQFEFNLLKNEAQNVLFKDPVRTAQ